MPVVVSELTGVAEVRPGGGHTCARLTDGTVRCWGSNADGQVGDGSSGNDRLLPVAVPGLTGVVQLAVGRYHTCALLATGTARCWGYNGFGALGDGTTMNRSAPVDVVGLSGASAIVAGLYFTCALLTDGTARCWGSNYAGEIGDGGTANRLSPTRVVGLSGAVELTAGGYGQGHAHACARLMDGSVRCWGGNSNGQIGDGTQESYYSVTAVEVPLESSAPRCNATPGIPSTEVCGNSVDEDCDGALNNGC